MRRGGGAGRRRPSELMAWVETLLGEGQRIALQSFRQAMRVQRKADRSPVTAADRRIEERLRWRLERGCPGEGIIGEEFGGSVGSRDAYWVIDPIDGTRAFSRGLPTWGILLARVERGVPTLGACAFPAMDTLIGVAPGVAPYERQGTVRRRLPQVRLRPLAASVILHGGSRWWAGTPYAAGFARVIGASYLERGYGDCAAYLWALRGMGDVVLEYGVHLWDLAPFAAFAQRTGRVLWDCSGQPSFRGPGAVFAHPALARRIVDTLRPGGR